MCRFRGRGSYSFQLPGYRTCIPSTDPQKQHKKWFSDSVRTPTIIAQGRIVGYVGSRNQDYWEPVPIGQIDTQLYHSSSRQGRDLILILLHSLILGCLSNLQPLDLPLDGYFLIFFDLSCCLANTFLHMNVCFINYSLLITVEQIARICVKLTRQNNKFHNNCSYLAQ